MKRSIQKKHILQKAKTTVLAFLIEAWLAG
jgi:hypothetical protein